MLAAVVERTGVELEVLSGEDEARLTFLAVRRWFGWSAGTLLVVDIGGGSLELAAGMDEEPDVAVSLPLGAGRLTRDLLPGDPPADEARARGAQAGARVDRRRAAAARQGRHPRPRRRHLQDDALAGPDLRRGAERRGACTPPAPSTRHALVGTAAARSPR